MEEKQVKVRVLTDKRLAHGLRWLGFRYTKDSNNSYVFERGIKFDRVLRDMYSLKADVGGYMYKSIKKDSNKNEM